MMLKTMVWFEDPFYPVVSFSSERGGMRPAAAVLIG